MKLYRTRTQEQYDYLMQKLEDEGYFWKTGNNPTDQNKFRAYGDETIIRANTSDDTLMYGHTGIYLDEAIIEVSVLMEPDEFAKKIQERNHKLFTERQEILTAHRTGNDKADKHQEITEELKEIYQSKNADYGDAFGETFEKLGIVSAVTRISDKTNRLMSLTQNDRQVEDETLQDTLMDLANYAIMTLIEMGVEK